MSAAREKAKSVYDSVVGRAQDTVEWITPMVGSWFRDWVPGMAATPLTPDPSNPSRIAGFLIEELVCQIHIAEERERLWKQQQQRESSAVDYSWLVMERPPAYDLAEVDRLELEELCRRVLPEECSQVIRSFRECLVREPAIEDMTSIFRAVVRRVLDNRPVPVATGFADWISRSISNLRSLALTTQSSGEHGLVGSVGCDLDLERQNLDAEDVV